MDEIVIEDKKYISTKRAAKVTGYAKDYVGQLCREGRVPARLVGRSWYVLESALADHRFGNEEESREPQGQEKKVEENKYPKYQADEIETIETLSVRKEEIVVQAEKEEKPERQTIQDAWEAWFDRVATATVHSVPEEVKEEEVLEESSDIPVHISREERVAIRTVVEEEDTREESPEPIMADAQSKKHITPERYATVSRRPSRLPIILFAKVGSGLLALFFVVVFILSTGFFDENIISAGRDVTTAGVSVYKK